MKEEKCTIKLNHKCNICKKPIYIHENPITNHELGPCHLDCLLQETKNKAIDHIQYILTYGLINDVTEEEIKNCEKLMKVFLTTHENEM